MKMFVSPPAIYLHRAPVDFRKAINGLVDVVVNEMELPLYEAVFVFTNRARNQLKVLYWDQTGFCLWQKRLEREKFKWPRKLEAEVIELNEQQWHWLLQGYDYQQFTPHKVIETEAFTDR